MLLPTVPTAGWGAISAPGLGVDGGVLLFGVLLALGVIGGVVTARYRVPGLLLFLGLGMLVADDGLALVRFDDAALAQAVAAVALAVILFEGGLATRPRAWRRAGAPAAALATVGVLVTAGVVAIAAALLFDLSSDTALLVGAVVASTDAAAVFGVLRGEAVPDRVRDLLQLESGANDPVAVMLTIGAVEAWRADPGAADWVGFALWQLGAGAAVGVAVGWLAGRLLPRLGLGSASSLGVLGVAIGAVAYGAAALAGASGFLAVYLTGLLLARDERLVRSIRIVHEGLAGTAQAVLFLLLGLLVFPSELPSVAGRAALVVVVLVLVARPLAVALCLPWFRFGVREQVLVGWAGLRGAVPIVLATIPLTAGHPDGELVFELTFVVVVVSVAVQAPTITPLARRLGLVAPAAGSTLELVPVDTLDADVVELHLGPGSPLVGSTLGQRPPPGGARVAVVVRDGRSSVPAGDTVLVAGDTLLLAVPIDTDTAPLARWAG